MLLSDGSVTRHLQLLTGIKVHVVCKKTCFTVPSPLWHACKMLSSHRWRAVHSCHLQSSLSFTASWCVQVHANPHAAVQDCLQMEEVSWSLDGAPHAVSSLKLPCLQRQVYLQECAPHMQAQPTQAEDSEPALQPQPLVYAVSWWNLSKVRNALKDTNKPIWASLSEQRVELYRELKNVYCGHWSELQTVFRSDDPLWGRDYVFWNSGEPLTVIREVFSPALCQHLGPLAAP
jgi:chorismate-pyruvate lyase